MEGSTRVVTASEVSMSFARRMLARSVMWGVTSLSADDLEREGRGGAKPWTPGAEMIRRRGVIKEDGDIIIGFSVFEGDVDAAGRTD